MLQHVSLGRREFIRGKAHMILYRPVGPKELALIAHSGFKSFPPRLPDQPIFYPVLNVEYAAQIAREWNSTGPEGAGFVTRFEVEQGYAEQFGVHVVGNRTHQELWVPAEQLAEFNRHIVGLITIEAAFYGDKFSSEIDLETNLPKQIARLLR